MRYAKIIFLSCCFFLFSASSLVSQSTNEGPSVIYSSSQEVTARAVEQPMVTKVMDADMYDYVFNVLKDNLWFVMVICVLVVLVLYMVILFLSGLLKGLMKRFDNSEYIEFGKLKIKNRNYKGNVEATTIKEFDVDKFLSMLELLLETELSNSISKTIDITNAIHALETNYNHQCEMIFRNTFSSIRNSYYTEFLNYLVNITGFTNNEVHKTREYFFMDDLLTNIEMLWIDYSKDIISRNGFVDIVEDRKKATSYIAELKDLIWQSIDVKKLEVTVIIKKELDKIITDTFSDIETQLETMFVRLGNLKKNVLEKKNNKLAIVDNDIKDSITSLLDEIRVKFLSPNQSIIHKEET